MTTGNFHLAKHKDGFHVWSGETHGGRAMFSEVLLWGLLLQARSLAKDLYANSALPADHELMRETADCINLWDEVENREVPPQITL